MPGHFSYPYKWHSLMLRFPMHPDHYTASRLEHYTRITDSPYWKKAHERHYPCILCSHPAPSPILAVVPVSAQLSLSFLPYSILPSQES